MTSTPFAGHLRSTGALDHNVEHSDERRLLTGGLREALGLGLTFKEFASTHVLVLVDLARREASIKDFPGLIVVAR
jgi:hypothetical protein